MTRTARWLVGLTAGFILLVLATVLVLTVLVDPNSYRDEIERAVRDVTARDFRLQGDIDIAWFPWLALDTGPAQLGNPRGFAEGPPLIAWQRARAGVRVLPLLRRELIVDRVRFDGLRANLRIAADGRTNWEGLMGERASRDAKTSRVPGNAGLEIHDGALAYTDARDGTHLEVTHWELDVGAFESGEPVEVRTAFRFRDVPVEFREDALTLDVESLRIDAPAWSLKVGDARLDGALRAQDNPRRIQGTARGDVPSVRELLAALEVTVPRTRDAEALGALRFAGAWQYDHGTLIVKPFELKLDDTALAGTLSRVGADEPPAWTFDLEGDRVDLDRYRSPDAVEGEPFELPVRQLKGMNVRGTLRFADAKLAGADAQDVTLSVVTDPAP